MKNPEPIKPNACSKGLLEIGKPCHGLSGIFVQLSQLFAGQKLLCAKGCLFGAFIDNMVISDWSLETTVIRYWEEC